MHYCYQASLQHQGHKPIIKQPPAKNNLEKKLVFWSFKLQVMLLIAYSYLQHLHSDLRRLNNRVTTQEEVLTLDGDCEYWQIYLI
jgi:hypothetical protein